MSNADCESAREAEAKEKLSNVISTIIKGLIEQGLSPEQIQQWLQNGLNAIDDESDWEVTVTRFN